MKINDAGVLLLGIVLGLMLSPVTANAAIKYFSTTVTVRGDGYANCPSGSKLTGGGVETLPSNQYGTSSSSEYSLTGSWPSGNSWRATAIEVRGSFGSSSGWRFSNSRYSPKVYAICTR